MKRLVLLMLSALLCFLFCGCGKEQVADVDYDLTKMSSTMVYAEVSNMLANPDDYKGKTVRMAGDSNMTHDGTHSCIVYDALGCCTEGIEYLLEDEKYPDDGESITVVGTFATYEKGDYKYFVLAKSVLE
ncbi:MAG: hypothetical protein K5675_04410 [Lachnospiraceae bacterium]|nr:hypothetical protein [Lachnospiraceae bacterium]